MNDWFGVEVDGRSEQKARRQFNDHTISRSPEALVEQLKRQMAAVGPRGLVAAMSLELNT